MFENCPGAVTDLIPFTIAFPFMQENDALDKDGNILTTQDIVDLFKRFEPNLSDE